MIRGDRPATATENDVTWLGYDCAEREFFYPLDANHALIDETPEKNIDGPQGTNSFLRAKRHLGIKAE